jgi:multidrug efflux pump subunit AcrA (membrane-fusion protein)
MSRLRARSIRRALGAYGVTIAALAGCGQEAPPAELPPRAIQWQRVSATLASQQHVISGIVTAIAETRLAFEVGGTVDLVEVDLGDRVEKGQRLARLDPEPFELAATSRSRPHRPASTWRVATCGARYWSRPSGDPSRRGRSTRP